MAGNDGASTSRGGGASLSAAATAAGSAETRFVPQERLFLDSYSRMRYQRRRWGGCFSGLSCFGSQKGGKRIVPASRTPDGNASAIRTNGPQSAGFSNQNTAMNLSLLAPPSSPASFSNSALPSTVPSPSCFLSVSANSPGGPSSTMYATGPYAHETQLVSPPAFSTYTTEPSTAPLTPPPELAHLTTPSSPDVPYARFLSSSRRASKENGMPFMPSNYVGGGDLQATYALYPGSPSSSLISPVSGTPRTGMTSPYLEQEGAASSANDSPCLSSRSSKLFGHGSTSKNFMMSADNSFFCPATSAQFYLDQAQQSFSGSGIRHHKPCKQDVEEIEAYRASFGFSADEIMASQNYVPMSEPADESFSISPFPEESRNSEMPNGVPRIKTACAEDAGSPSMKGRDQTVSETLERLGSRRIPSGHSCSDAEIDYKRSRSLRDAHGILAWRKSQA